VSNIGDWHTDKFMVVPPLLMPDGSDTDYMILLTDLKFWSDHVDEFVNWCLENGCTMQGMTVNIPTAETLTLFAIRWA